MNGSDEEVEEGSIILSVVELSKHASPTQSGVLLLSVACEVTTLKPESDADVSVGGDETN